ncbi:anthranilate phosphoribosyltransferase [Paenibacillus sp. SORGH_AS306]|uniref:anthranilate phosphoribosyltransferase n=1 Tax=unclassified Paenibacillus TaxID=185978 RepID=UPI00278AA46E|nr:anthranilate phosphoribosyltransferase [Paenibacillus sp. SORGH_AS_0306]MDR6108429.1 anthranilate phosphoribosyltransferase [Paenibacillus sp. SORGH_AS_0338]
MNMTDILKEVGRGKRGSRDLTYDEALAVGELILNREASDVQIGAFFMAERMKMENIEEMHAFVDICRKYALRTSSINSLDCAAPYDGRTASFIASFATSFVLAATGQKVTLHGSEPLPPKWGVTLPLLLREMGVNTKHLTRDQSLYAAQETGLLFVAAEQWCPPLGALRTLREEIGVRTILNSAEKLMNYSHSPYLVYGVFHNTFFERISKVLQRLDYQRAAIIQGAEGSEDLFIDRPTRTYRVERGEAHMEIIDPEVYGLDISLPEMSWTASTQIEVTEQVLRGQADLAFTNQVLLNSAYRLALTGKTGSIEEGVYTAKSILESGKAYQVYQHWGQLMRGEQPNMLIGNRL